MLINIQGDVWLLSDIICIALDEPDEGEPWQISLRIRGEDKRHIYDQDSHEEAKRTHIALVQAWTQWLSGL